MRRVVAGLLALTAALVFAQPATAKDWTLERYAEGTWRSFDAMTDARSGLPSDILESDGDRSVQTSTTNIGAYMWSAVVAEELGIIRRSRARVAHAPHRRARSRGWSATPTRASSTTGTTTGRARS